MRRIGRMRKSVARVAILAPAAAVVMVLSLGCATASPEGQIVLRGGESSSHLKLALRGDEIVAEGNMDDGQLAGCHTAGSPNVVACPLAGVDSIVVDMGPSDDKVEVLDSLPIPLTAYLGRGSDKLIGNSEPDICYPEGTRRNRCIGGPGRDICITGPRNSDCVGGAGNDYCQHSTGSDGCWGGPGQDVCRMGPGHDGCHGEGGDDRLYGGASSDQLYGGAGTDYCDGGPGIGRSHGCEKGPGG